MQLPALLCGMERGLDRIETAIARAGGLVGTTPASWPRGT